MHFSKYHILPYLSCFFFLTFSCWISITDGLIWAFVAPVLIIMTVGSFGPLISYMGRLMKHNEGLHIPVAYIILMS